MLEELAETAREASGCAAKPGGKASPRLRSSANHLLGSAPKQFEGRLQPFGRRGPRIPGGRADARRLLTRRATAIHGCTSVLLDRLSWGAFSAASSSQSASTCRSLGSERLNGRRAKALIELRPTKRGGMEKIRVELDQHPLHCSLLKSEIMMPHRGDKDDCSIADPAR